MIIFLFLSISSTIGSCILLLWLLKLFSRQDKILYILDTTILILYRKLYINIVSIIVLNIEARKYKIRIILLCRAALEKIIGIWSFVLNVLLE